MIRSLRARSWRRKGAHLPKYRVSYSDAEHGSEIAVDGAVDMDLSAILELMDRVLGSVGSYINVADGDGGLFTLLVDAEDGNLLLDLPAPREHGSYAKRATLAECRRALTMMDGRIDRAHIEGLVFERW
jgi:hypothetical protein